MLTEAQAETHRTKDGWQIRDEGKGRFRRVVPSPLPRKIIEMPAIDRLVEAGQIVVCCGGGGIPVAVDSMGRVRGVAAVIDKDRTTGLLARHLQSPTLVILTAVEYACINFGKPNEQQLEQISADEAEEYLNAGQFGAGSMRPKIETAIDFVRHSPHADAVAIIAHVNRFADALDGKSGTRIVETNLAPVIDRRLSVCPTAVNSWLTRNCRHAFVKRACDFDRTARIATRRTSQCGPSASPTSPRSSRRARIPGPLRTESGRPDSRQ